MSKQASKGFRDKQKLMAMLDQLEQDAPEASKRTQISEFESLFIESLREKDFKPGDIVRGRVVNIQNDFVLVDINYKSEGLIPIQEFRVVDGVRQINIGDSIEVMIDRIEGDNGMIVLSKNKADMLKAWTDISKAAENEEVIEGTVVGKVKGGLSVDIGVTAFLPGSQIDIRPVKNLDIYVGKKFKFKVVKFNKKRGNIVLSRRSILEQERESMRSQAIGSMKEGSLVTGLVKNITDYGAFIDLGGMDGLLHITDMSWGRLKHPSELLSLGQEVQVKILKFDNEKERVSLGLKQLRPDPWEGVKERYKLNEKVRGKIVSVADYGAFVELEEGVEGLIHVSEMTWGKKVKSASQLVQAGEEVDVVVLEVDSENRRISLGMKQLHPNPWLELKESYPPGTIIEGEVKSVTDFGVFVGVEEGVDGLVHISDFSWTKRVQHPSEMFEKGQRIRVVVLGVDVDNQRFSLGVKQLESDPWTTVELKFPVGSVHEVKVLRIVDFGAFVELATEIEGLIHISELSTEKIQRVEDFIKVGDVLQAEVISIDLDARKIGLSAKSVKMRETRSAMDDQIKRSSSKSTLGDLFADQLRDVNRSDSDKKDS
jgi:small subunit ribosomal protein S1